jgi:hypothetical protein
VAGGITGVMTGVFPPAGVVGAGAAAPVVAGAGAPGGSAGSVTESGILDPVGERELTVGRRGAAATGRGLGAGPGLTVETGRAAGVVARGLVLRAGTRREACGTRREAGAGSARDATESAEAGRGGAVAEEAVRVRGATGERWLGSAGGASTDCAAADGGDGAATAAARAG